jgi:hypothetical protein
VRKYEDVDIVAALGAVVELNTEHYKGDFKYDIERFREAAKHPEGEAGRFLWLSRQSGTWCFPERDVYVKDTEAFNYWNSYGKLLGSPDFWQPVVVDDRILAFAVNIRGIENGRVKGDLYEVDYRDHIRQVNRVALPAHTVSARYADGTEFRMPFKEHNEKHMGLYHSHGQLVFYRVYPEDRGALRDVLKTVRDKREKEARPAAFKVRVQNPKSRKPSIKQEIAAGKERLARERAAAPRRTAAKSRNELEV